jgi:putative nucleotidyltransferase with HDIG domain
LLASLKKRFARWKGVDARPAEVRPSGAPAGTRRSDPRPILEEDVVVPDQGPSEGKNHQPDDAPTQIRRAFARGTHELRNRYADALHEGDGRSLLASLGEKGSVLVKQPPIAAQAVLSVIQRRDCSLTQLARVVEKDPALLQDLLRHANSAYYATSMAKPVTSVAMAVRRMGTSGVYATVMARIVEGQFTKPGGELDGIAVMVWEHLIRTAPIARMLARSFKVDAEEAFTLGLLHDVGKLILFDRVADLRRRRRREVDLPEGFIVDALALLHEPVGATACTSWGLSDEFLRAMVHHHRRPPTRTPCPLSEVAFLAERIDLAAQRGEDLDLPALWAEGQLTGPMDAVAEVVEGMRAEAETETESETEDGDPEAGVA